MSDDRPSIANLQRLDSAKWATWPNDSTIAIANAAPVLLEIAAAALARQDAMERVDSGKTDDWGEVNAANDRLAAALTKVRP